MTNERQEVAHDLPGSTCLAANHLEITLHRRTVRSSIISSTDPTMVCSGLLISWATPATSSPMADSRSLCTS